MIKFENTEVMGWEHAIRGMRNPMNSWEKSDSGDNIITLCGSSKFKNEFIEIQKKLSLKGYLVLSLGLFGHSGDKEAWDKKDLLDKVHKQKIDMSSSIFVIDVNGYVGNSTKKEIEYAKLKKKKIYYYSKNDLQSIFNLSNRFHIGPNDLDLMKRLRNAGADHRKFMRMITVYVDITAPLYWWKEFDTYKVGTVANSCSTMHKIHAKEFTMEDFSCEHLMSYDNSNYWEEDDDDSCFIENNVVIVPMSLMQDYIIPMLNTAREKYLETKDKKYWWQMIQLLPSSYNQKRTVMMNYEVLANIYKSRKNHKLDEWAPNGGWSFCDWIKLLPYSELITGESLKDIPICDEIMDEERRRVKNE